MSERSTSLIGALLFGAVLLLAALAGVRSLLATWHSSAEGVERSAGLSRSVAVAPLAWQSHLELGDLRKALRIPQQALLHYQAALEAYPACGRCWAGLAEVELTMQRPATAESAIEKAVVHGGSSTSVRTRAAVVFARLGRHDRAASEFGASISGHRTGKHELFALTHRLYDERFVLERIVRDSDLASYFHWVRENRVPQFVARVWEELPADLQERYREDYSAYLLRKGLYSRAWQVVFPGGPPPTEAGLLDPGFEGGRGADLRASGPFGWRLEDADGVEVSVERCSGCPGGARGLRLRFDGEHNPDFRGVMQPVPVRPGARYRLSAMVRAKEVTSARGVQLAVRGSAAGGTVGGAAGGTSGGAKCELWVAGDEIRLTQPWRKSELEFEVPAACDGVRVMVVRVATDRLNRMLGGEIWWDDFTLERIAAPTVPSTEGVKVPGVSPKGAPESASRAAKDPAGQPKPSGRVDSIDTDSDAPPAAAGNSLDRIRKALAAGAAASEAASAAVRSKTRGSPPEAESLE